jgi:hypothetical protein
MRNVATATCKEVVDADHVIAFRNKRLAQVRAEEPSPAGHEDPLHF